MMKIKISENLRRLRKEKGLTQETLAAMLSITPQSVSKWECAEGYPDITLLPMLAGCLGVTIDVLLGNDKIIAEERIQGYLAEYKRLTASDQTWKSAFTVAQNAYQEFSYDYRIIMLYVNALKVHSPTEYEKEKQQLCEIVLKNCDDPQLCADATYHICGLRNAEDQKAFLSKYIDYGQDWNWFKVYPMDSDEYKIMMQHEMFDKWWHLDMYIYSYGNLFCEKNGRQVSHEEKIKLIRKCEAIFHAYLDSDDLGEFTFYLGQYNEFLAREYAALGDKEQTLEHFEKAVDGWIAYLTLPKNYTYRNILLTHRPYQPESVKSTCGILKRYQTDVEQNPDFDFVRGEERFVRAYTKLCQSQSEATERI